MELSGGEIFEFAGIKFESLSLPWRKRWEAISVAMYLLSGIMLGPFMPFILYYLINSPFWSLLLLYFCWMIYDWNTPNIGGRKLCLIRNKPFAAIQDYFPSALIKTADLPANNNYLFCAFPHGVICFGVLSNFMPDIRFKKIFPGLEPRVITLSSMFSMPFTREFLLWAGSSAATANNIDGLLTHKENNKAAVLVVGGVAEGMLSEPGTNKVVIKDRKGFVKIALKSGSPLVPVYTFGENDIYDQFRGKTLQKIQNFVRKWLGIPPIMMKGRGLFQLSFGILPHRKPITTVVGKPITLPKCENPTQEQVNEYHSIFVSELKQLFDTYKEKYDAKGNEAELICL